MLVEESAPRTRAHQVRQRPARLRGLDHRVAPSWRVSVNACCDGSVAFAPSVSRSRSAGNARPGQVEVEVLRIRRRIGHLDHRQRRVLGVRERAHHVLTRIDIQRCRARPRVRRGVRAAARAHQVRQRPARTARTRPPCAHLAGRVSVNACCDGSVAFAPSVSRSRSAGNPDPVRSKSKSCGSDAGSVTLTTVNDASLVFVNVHTTFSPASISSVAVRVPVLVEESAPRARAHQVRQRPARLRGLDHRLAPSCAALA